MPTPDLRANRLRTEAMDWCRQQGTASDLPLSAHRESIQWRPEVWKDYG